jgi:hypothetical protein
VITDWATVVEPVPSPVFLFPSYATDIQILNPANGIVMGTPDGTSLYRVFIDFDGAIDTEFVAAFNGFPPVLPLPVTGPFPPLGQCNGDLMILADGRGILFPGGPSSISPRIFYRLRLDNDGDVGSEPANSAFWMRIPEHNTPVSLDASGNWVFFDDIIMAVPGIGIVMPQRGGSGTNRVRIDFDGDVVSE